VPVASGRPGRAPLISLIVPTYKERDNVIALLEHVRPVLTDRAFEVGIVDETRPTRPGESPRRTPPLILRWWSSGAAEIGASAPPSSRGFNHTRGAVLAVMDADLSHDPAPPSRPIDTVEGGDSPPDSALIWVPI
jgi:dolichol-phosphate mannosyltransferase